MYTNRNANTKQNISKNVHTSIICKNIKLQTKYPSTVDKLWLIYTMDHCQTMRVGKAQFTCNMGESKIILRKKSNTKRHTLKDPFHRKFKLLYSEYMDRW